VFDALVLWYVIPPLIRLLPVGENGHRKPLFFLSFFLSFFLKKKKKKKKRESAPAQALATWPRTSGPFIPIQVGFKRALYHPQIPNGYLGIALGISTSHGQKTSGPN